MNLHVNLNAKWAECSPRMREQAALLEQITAPLSRICFVANNVGQGEAIIGNPRAEAVAMVNMAHDKAR